MKLTSFCEGRDFDENLTVHLRDWDNCCIVFEHFHILRRGRLPVTIWTPIRPVRFPSGWTLQFNGAGTSFRLSIRPITFPGRMALKLVGSACWSSRRLSNVAFPQPQPTPHQARAISGDVFVDYLGTEDAATQPRASECRILPGWSIWDCVAQALFGSDGFVYSWSGSAATKLSAYKVGKWHTVSLDVDMTAGTFEHTVDGVLEASGVPVGAGFSPAAVTLDAGHGGNDPTVWYDNIVVRTPEVSE